jgi:MoxR-like ATPase
MHRAAAVRSLFSALRDEVHRVFVGQEELVKFVLYSLLADGHVLIEGVPGLGKTLLVRTLADAMQLSFSRIQFTPDLMPADITGTTVLSERADRSGHELQFQPGPLVANVVLADEINRATPKTQSALLEAMQERQISASGRTIRLPDPFIVLATQNPVEHEGTYALPEAQLDRFMVKLLVDYPTEDEYHQILDRTTSSDRQSVTSRFDGQSLIDARMTVREVPVSRQVQTYVIRVIMATQPESPLAPSEIRKFIAYGAGPRAAQSVLLMAKVRALMEGRFAVSCQDVRDVALPVLRHRLVLNFAALTERVSADRLAAAAMAAVPELSETE